MSGTASTSTTPATPKSPQPKPPAPLPAAAFTRPVCGAEDDVWRCSICGWEIETDDGVRGFCSKGHRFDITNIPGFEALDEDPAGDESGSVASGESWDDYESDGLVEDDLLEDPEARIRLVLRDVDRKTREVQSLWTNPLDGPLLLGALDAIAEDEREAGVEGDGGFALLLRLINTVEMEEDEEEEEGSAEEDTVEQKEEAAKEGQEEESEQEEENFDEIYMNRDGDSLSITEALYETSDEEDVSSYEDDSEDGYESSSDEGSKGEYEGDSDDEEEVENVAKTSEPVKASASTTKAEGSPASKQDDTVAKLEGTIAFLTQLLKDTRNSSLPFSTQNLPIRTTGTTAQESSPASPKPSQPQTSKPDPMTAFTFTAPPGWYDKYKTLVEPDGATPKQDLLFNPEKIKSFMDERKELLQQAAANLPMGDRKADDLVTELEGCGDDLCEAVSDARIERNAQMGRRKPNLLGVGGFQKEWRKDVAKDGKCASPQLASSFAS